MDKPHRKYKMATPNEQKAVITDIAAGHMQSDVAKRYGFSRSTVERIWKKHRTAIAGQPTLSRESNEVWQDRLTAKAIKAVEAGLDCEVDQYRRAGVGTKTLEGLGHFKTNHVQLNQINLVGRLPSEWKHDFIGLEEGDLKDGR